MQLPNGENAIVTDEKLLRYILSPDHPVGKQHARLFDLLLGINLTNAYLLRQALIDAAKQGDGTLGQASPYGTKYEIRFQMTGPRKVCTVLSVWMVPDGTLTPHLVTAYVE